MKIAIVVPSFNVGGLETSLLRIGKNLKRNGHEVTIVTTEAKGEWFDRIDREGIGSVSVPGFFVAMSLIHAYRVGCILREMKFDIIFTVFDRHSQASLCLLSDTVIVIPLLRNDHPDVYEIALSNRNRWNVAVANSPKVLLKARSIVPEAKFEMIPNGVVKYKLTIETDRWTNSIGIQAVFVGRLIHESKRILLLPEIVEKCRLNKIPITLKIVGDGQDRLALLEEIRRRGLESEVEIMGYKSPTELAGIYRNSHIMFFLSAYEGLPNVLLESQSYGCIPIATNLKGITDFAIRDGDTGILIDGVDTNDFVAAVERLANNMELARRMSISAQKWIDEFFSEEAEANGYRQLIDLALKNEYPIQNTRRSLSINLSTYSLSYWYRFLVKPMLAPTYIFFKKLIKKM